MHLHQKFQIGESEVKMSCLMTIDTVELILDEFDFFLERARRITNKARQAMNGVQTNDAVQITPAATEQQIAVHPTDSVK